MHALTPTQVRGFGKELLTEIGTVSKMMDGLGRFFGGGKKEARVPPSAADPSCLAGEKVATEDDALHVRDLPTYGGRLSERDAEVGVGRL